MTEEFTPEAKSLWADIPAEEQSLLLENVWCPTWHGALDEAKTILNR